jgi:hypothetical protein
MTVSDDWTLFAVDPAPHTAPSSWTPTSSKRPQGRRSSLRRACEQHDPGRAESRIID